MAWLRLEPRGYRGSGRIYDGICETVNDMDDAEGEISYNGSMIAMEPGSMCYCVTDQQCYVLAEDHTWTAVE